MRRKIRGKTKNQFKARKSDSRRLAVLMAVMLGLLFLGGVKKDGI